MKVHQNDQYTPLSKLECEMMMLPEMNNEVLTMPDAILRHECTLIKSLGHTYQATSKCPWVKFKILLWFVPYIERNALKGLSIDLNKLQISCLFFLKDRFE